MGYDKLDDPTIAPDYQLVDLTLVFSSDSSGFPTKPTLPAAPNPPARLSRIPSRWPGIGRLSLSTPGDDIPLEAALGAGEFSVLLGC